MGGGLAQLTAFGNADVYITGSPTISFWKSVYKRYTAFAIESVVQAWNGTVDFGRKVTAQIARNGDLVYKCWLEIDLPDLSTYIPTPNTATDIKWCNSVALACLVSVELEIGGQRIDYHPAEWLDIWAELTETQEKLAGYYEMTGKYDAYDNTSPTNSYGGAKTYFVPLQFYYCAVPGQALPYVALTYHDIRINVQFRNALDCVRSSGASLTSLISTTGQPLAMGDCRLYADFVYLSDAERKRMAQIPHEYLCTTTQFLGDEAVLSTTLNRKVTVNFNHPTMELIFVYSAASNQNSDTLTGNGWFDWSLPGTNQDPFGVVGLSINGHDRFTPRSGAYFRLVQCYQAHTRCPTKKVYCYSFALDPEKSGVQPSGTINLSRIESTQFQFTMNPLIPNGVIKVFGRSYNVLRIASGLAGLAFEFARALKSYLPLRSWAPAVGKTVVSPW